MTSRRELNLFILRASKQFHVYFSSPRDWYGFCRCARQLNFFIWPHTALLLRARIVRNSRRASAARLVGFQEITAESKDEGDSDEAESPEAKLKE